MVKDLMVGIKSGLSRLGLDFGRISSPESSVTGLYLKWAEDPPGATCGMVVDARIDGQDISFFVIDAFDEIQRHHLSGCFYEEEELAIIGKYFHGGVFVDIGANVGNHAIYALKFLAAARVIAFEPNPRAHRVLRLNVAINDLQDRIVLHQLGLSDRPGCATFETPRHNLGATRLLTGSKQGELEVVPGDSILSSEAVDFLKIDAEGLEMQVLAGLGETIAGSRPTMFVEVDQANIPAFRAFCAKADYRIATTYRRYRVNCNFLVVPSEKWSGAEPATS